MVAISFKIFISTIIAAGLHSAVIVVFFHEERSVMDGA